MQVAINSLETESNKQTITSNVSGSNLNNNNKNSANNQQQQQQKQKQTTESKESNFDDFDDDNEWDVGGIGDLIIDLDNDIEKSSGTVTLDVPKTSTEQISSNSSSSTSSSLSSVSTPTIASTSLASSTSKTIETSTSCSSGSSNKSQENLTDTKVECSEAVNIPLIVNSANAELKTATTEHHHKTPKAQQTSSSSTIGGSKSKISPTSDTIAGGTMSSNASGQGAGKAGNKLAIDHQATLDKGLKMKIKRTKPGTKTSEAKHEIVKAEQQQNGALSGADDSNSSSSGSSNGNKKSVTQPSPVLAAQALGSSGNGGSGGAVTPVSSIANCSLSAAFKSFLTLFFFCHSTATAIANEFIDTTATATANHI